MTATLILNEFKSDVGTPYQILRQQVREYQIVNGRNPDKIVLHAGDYWKLFVDINSMGYCVPNDKGLFYVNGIPIEIKA